MGRQKIRVRAHEGDLIEITWRLDDNSQQVQRVTWPSRLSASAPYPPNVERVRGEAPRDS